MRNMKLITVTAACMLASACALSGCGSKTTETTAAATTAAAETSAAAETTAAGESAAETSAAAEGETESSESAASSGALDTATLELISKISQISPERPESLGTVKLGDYTGIDISAPRAEEITDEAVDEYITNSILPNYPSEITDGEVQDGDTATINFVGSIDGVEFEGGKGEDYPLVIGSGAFIPGFEDQLIGAHYGETVNVNVTFPEDYGAEDLAGKDALFVVDINKIERPRTLDQIDDDYVKEITDGNNSTVAEFKAFIKENLQRSNDIAAKEELADAVLKKVLETSEVTPSQEAIDWQKDIYITTYDAALSRAYGMNLASMISMYGQTYEEFRDSLTEGATEAATRAALVYELAAKEGLTVSDESKEKYAKTFGYDDVDQLAAATSESELELAVLSNEVTDFVVANSNVTYTEPTEDTGAEATETEAAAEPADAAEDAADAAAETEAE